MKKLFFPFIVLFLVFLLLMPRTPRFSYDYRKGSAWKYETLMAQFDFPIYKSDEQIGEELEKSAPEVIPYFRYSSEAVNRSLKSVEGTSFGTLSQVKTATLTAMKKIFARGVMSDEGVKTDRRRSSSVSDELIYIQKEKRVSKRPSSEVYRLSDAKAALLAQVMEQCPSVNVDSVFREEGIYDQIIPNLIFDQPMTDLVHSESVSQVSPTSGFVTAGQLIVSKGEIVTAEIAQMLDSYKKEYNSSMGYSRPGFLQWMGNLFLALAIVSALFFAIYCSSREVLSKFNALCYILMIFLLCSIGALMIGRENVQFIYMVPFPLAALLLKPFFHRRTVAPVYMVCLLPLLLFAQEGAALYVMFTVTGLVYLYTMYYFRSGFTLFVNAGIGFGVILLVFLGFRLTDTININIPLTVLYLFIGQVLSIALCPLAYLFERMFALVSDASLEDLANADSKLLQELEAAAPGTYQHSMQVMGMADAVARAIGANVPLVRAGALYHDLGKINNPLCFVENESIMAGPDAKPYHSGLTAQQSASAIIAHVTDGQELARRRGLPKSVAEFITTHHGTSLVGYFYNKYVNEGGDPALEGEFRYPGHKPSTREQVILMVCDSVEAASRTVSDNSVEVYSELVDSIISSKMADGQLEDADISLKDLKTIKSTLATYLVQLYHGRVAYPKLKKNIKNKIV